MGSKSRRKGAHKRAGSPKQAKPGRPARETSEAPDASPSRAKQPPKSVPSLGWKTRLRRLSDREAVRVGAIFLVAFGLRLLNLLAMRENSPFYDMPTTDSDLYDKLARAIAEGDWLGTEIFYYNPLYPYFLGLCYTLFGYSYTIVKLLQIAAGSPDQRLVSE